MPFGVVGVHSITSLNPTTETIQLFDDGLPEHGDAKAGDGVYSTLYTNTMRPGTYDVQLSFRMDSASGGSVTRTESKTLAVGMKQFDLSKSMIDIRPAGRFAYDISITLIDKYGNYFSPGQALAAIVTLPNDKWGGRRVMLEDNLDGNFFGRITLEPSEIAAGASIRLEAGGRSVAQVPLAGSELVIDGGLLWWFWLLLLLEILLIILLLALVRRL